MTTLNKADASLGKMQYHLKLKPGDVGKYVLLPGDPDRVFRISKYLDDVKEVVFHREYRTCTGSYKGIKISATSTGIGCPSAAIAVEELANVGATHFIRVGSTGALQPHINVGDIIINTASMRNEGTTKFYVNDGFPAVADHFLTHTLIQAGTEIEKKKPLKEILWCRSTSKCRRPALAILRRNDGDWLASKCRFKSGRISMPCKTE